MINLKESRSIWKFEIQHATISYWLKVCLDIRYIFFHVYCLSGRGNWLWIIRWNLCNCLIMLFHRFFTYSFCRFVAFRFVLQTFLLIWNVDCFAHKYLKGHWTLQLNSGLSIGNYFVFFLQYKYKIQILRSIQIIRSMQIMRSIT